MDVNIVDQYQEIENLDNVMNIDGTQAIFVDGRYYIPTNTKAIFMPETDSQYNINNAGNILFDTNFETSFCNRETVHLIENTEVKVEDDRQILYYTDEVKNLVEMKEEECSQNVKFGFMDNMNPSLKPLEIECDFVNIDSVLENINNVTDNTENGSAQSYQYIVQFENYDAFENSPDNSMHETLKNGLDESDSIIDESSQLVDISKITGKNLLTGETVTLDNYLEKVKNINKELTLEKAEEISQNIRKRSQHTALSNLLNKKLTIGKTLTGQRLIGKVIHVGKKELERASNDSTIYEPFSKTIENIDEDNSMVPSIFSLIADDPIKNVGLSTEMSEDSQEDDTTILLDNQHEIEGLAETKCELTQCNDEEYCNVEEQKMNQMDHHMVEYVSRTLTNLMSMESVSKKLKRKNLYIKVIEKVMADNNKYKANIYQMQGHLEMLGGWEEEGYEEKWLFKLNKEFLNNDELLDYNHKKFPESMRLIISIVLVDGIVQSTKVNLNYCQEKCSICSKEFRTIYKLKSHMKVVHQIAVSQFYCQLCDESLEDKDMFTQHRLYHVERNELFPCSRCDKHFLTKIKLAKHMLCHDPSSVKLVCTICGENSSKVSTWKRHMLTHTTMRPYTCKQCNKQFISLTDLNYHSRAHDAKNCYVCKVCNRTFSRYSNLQRHSEIHGTKNSRSAYSCSMCGCTYNYVSSLTRHIVQNHISAS
ncbi:hypothetical protein WA026_002776 [Henosepilachna vigintioctopunctata]|uniref:C2H2-type domain-containing protein n=1 Tax=Henosepilachna vigintioctopunctata TaxID=420089 RepID=A0AAW1TSA5_9CUCU